MIRYRITIDIDMPLDTSRRIFNETIKEWAIQHLPIGGNVVYVSTEMVSQKTVIKRS